MSRDSVRVAPSASLAQSQGFLGLHVTTTLNNLAPLSHHDVLFVAIDFEGTEHSGHGISQIGVSILDTRGLPCASILGQSVVKTELYCISKRPKNQRLDKKTRKIFTLGEVKWIRKHQAVDTLTTIFQECSSYSILSDDTVNSQIKSGRSGSINVSLSSDPRDIVLVGHGLNNELKNMQILGFQPQLHANIIAQIDTEDLWDEFQGRIECETKVPYAQTWFTP